MLFKNKLLFLLMCVPRLVMAPYDRVFRVKICHIQQDMSRQQELQELQNSIIGYILVTLQTQQDVAFVVGRSFDEVIHRNADINAFLQGATVVIASNIDPLTAEERVAILAQAHDKLYRAVPIIED